MFATLVIGIVLGLVIGVFSGLLGIGGGTIMVPVFRLALGLSAVMSTATSLFTIIPTSIAGAISHWRNKTCVPRFGFAMGIGGALTSPLGVWLAQVTPSWMIMAVAAVVIAYSASTMLRKALASRKTASATAASTPPSAGMPVAGTNASSSPQTNIAESNANASSSPQDSAPETASEPPIDEPIMTRKRFFQAAVIGATAGVISGYIGVGGGFLMVPMMLSILNMPMKLASGTSLIAIMILAAPATVGQCLIGNVDYLVGISVACGSIPGALIGAKLINKVPESTLRFIFAGFLAIAAILLVVKEAGLLG